MKSIVTLAIATACALVGVDVTSGQERPATSATEQRIAELERQVAALAREIRELRQDVRPRPRAVIIPVKHFEPEEYAGVVRDVYRGSPGVVVHTVFKMKCIAVQANAQTTEEIRELVKSIEKTAQEGAKVRAFFSRPDPVAITAALRAIEKAREETAKAELAKRQGRWVMKSWEEDGLLFPQEETNKWRMIVKGHDWVLTRDGKEMSRGTFRIDTNESPYHEDSTVTDEVSPLGAYRGIYAIEGDRFTCCYARKPRARPDTFESGPGRTSIVWQRERP